MSLSMKFVTRFSAMMAAAFMGLWSCGGDDTGTTTATTGGPCATVPRNDCGGCTDLREARPGLVCGDKSYWVCDGIEKTKCVAGDGPPVTALVASTDREDRVLLSWTPAPDRPARSFVVLRDGVELTSVGAPRYDDFATAAAKLEAPAELKATDGVHADRIELSWSPAKTVPGAAHKYQVLPVYAQGAGLVRGLPSAEVVGSRGAKVRYELNRDNGGWFDAGEATSYADKQAPGPTLVNTDIVHAQVVLPSFVVQLQVGEQGRSVSIRPPSASTYRLRAVTGTGTAEADKTAKGVRKGGSAISAVQWQRSAADSDASYTDLPGVTGHLWYDAAPPNQPRFYRARFTYDGGDLPSKAVRVAGPFGATQVVFGKEGDFSCALRAGGGLSCLGNDTWERVSKAPTGSFSKLTLGYTHACAVATADGAVSCWGLNDSRVTPPADVKAPLDIAASSQVTCAIKADEKIKCWGPNIGNQVSAAPTENFKAIFGSSNHAFCAIRKDNDFLTCWGANDGNIISARPLSTPFKAISLARDYGCGLHRDTGAMVCWGSVGTRGPVVGAAEPYKALNTSLNVTCGLRMDNTVDCFGPPSGAAFVGRSTEKFDSLVAAGNHAVCGLSAGVLRCLKSAASELIPNLPSTEAYKQLSVGMYDSHTVCALRTDGRLECWGNWARLSTAKYKKVAVGRDHMCAVTEASRLECLEGFDPFNERPDLASATVVDLTVPWRKLYHNNNNWPCVLTAAGTAVCFNEGDPVSEPGIKALARGRDGLCFIRANDDMVCDGQVFKGPFVSISGSNGHGGACGVGKDGRISCYNVSDQGFPASTVAYKSVALTQDAICAVTNEGVRECRGRNSAVGNQRQGTVNSLAAPSGNSADRFAQVGFSNLRQLGCGIRSDDRLYCWGQGLTGFPHFDGEVR